MLLFHLLVPRGVFDAPSRSGLARALTKAIRSLLQVGDTSRKARLAWGVVQEIPTGSLYVGGCPSKRPRYCLHLMTPAGGIAEETRSQLVRIATELILEREDTPYSDGEAERVWILFHDMGEASWGGSGRLFSMRAAIAA